MIFSAVPSMPSSPFKVSRAYNVIDDSVASPRWHHPRGLSIAPITSEPSSLDGSDLRTTDRFPVSKFHNSLMAWHRTRPIHRIGPTRLWPLGGTSGVLNI